MNVTSLTSPIGLTAILKARVCVFVCCHLGILEPEVNIFGREAGAELEAKLAALSS